MRDAGKPALLASQFVEQHIKALGLDQKLSASRVPMGADLVMPWQSGSHS
jgi:hypothetical protein